MQQAVTALTGFALPMSGENGARLSRRAIEDQIEALIDLLDATDGEADMEEDDPAEDDGVDEAEPDDEECDEDCCAAFDFPVVAA